MVTQLTPDAQDRLQRLIDGGVRSPGWRFDTDLEAAERAGHPDLERLRAVAALLTDSSHALPAVTLPA